MIVGVDASNLRAGGGITHLVELLSVVTPEAHGVRRVVVWGGKQTLDRLPARPWVERVYDHALDLGLAGRLLWQRKDLDALARAAGCNVLFAPGGATAARFRPRVVMSRNMLPFEPEERGRYGLSWMRVRLAVLRAAQGRSFSDADGTIFLTRYADQSVRAVLASPPRQHAVIPHGVDDRFRLAPRAPRPLEACSAADPLRVLYVSQVSPYKHQGAVVEAVRRLRAEGLPVALDLVGAEEHRPSVRALRERVRGLDPEGAWLRWRGGVPFADVHRCYRDAEVFVFASSCENMPNTLLEAMASGLPVACSDRGPMPEIIGASAVYFDPERPDDIARAVRALARSTELRTRCATGSYERALRFSWGRCADETFAFLARVARDAR